LAAHATEPEDAPPEPPEKTRPVAGPGKDASRYAGYERSHE
jgi:hypothetical protein